MNGVDCMNITASSAQLGWAEQVSGKMKTLLFNAQEGKREACQVEAQQSCNALRWTNLNTEEACNGMKVWRLQLNLRSPWSHFSLREISHSTAIRRFNNLPWHPTHYEVLINWAGEEADWLIALAVSSQQHTGAAGHTHLAPRRLPHLRFTLH